MNSLFTLFSTFFQIGLFSIGGGYAIIPMIQEQVVEKYGWISQKTFTDIITISQMTPGPIAVNTSTFVGIQIAKLPGAIIATIGCVSSGIVIALSLNWFFKKYKSSKYVFETLKGLKAASLGLIISAAATIFMLTFFNTTSFHMIRSIDWRAVLIFLCSMILLRRRKTNPIMLMMLSGLVGVILYQF